MLKEIVKYLPSLLILLPFVLIAQDSNDEIVVRGNDEEMVDWGNYKLTWSDFKANPEPGSDAAASTTTYIGIEYKILEGKFDYSIHCRFSRNRSWGLHKTEYILRHEQGHFDIAEIFARKLNKAMSEYSFNKRTFQKDLKRIYQDIMDEKENFQHKYDKETNHSINRARQAEWLKKIDSLLSEYEDYAAYN